MMSQLEEEGFYRTLNGSIGFVLSGEEADGLTTLVMLKGRADDGVDEWEPGDFWHIDSRGAVLGCPEHETHPLCVVERLPIEVAEDYDWQPLPALNGIGYEAALSVFSETLETFSAILQAGCEHTPINATPDRLYLTLNRSVSYVTDICYEDSYLAVLLKGGIGDRKPGYSYRLAIDGSPIPSTSPTAFLDVPLSIWRLLLEVEA